MIAQTPPSSALTRLLAAFFLALVLLAALPATAARSYLKPEAAFQITGRALSAQLIAIDARVAPGYYLYRDRFSVTAQTPGLTLGAPQFPPGEDKDDPNFGQVVVYHQPLTLHIPVTTAPAGPVTLEVGYQGCAEEGICYPPMTTTVVINLADIQAVTDPAAATNETSRIASLLRDGGVWLTLLSFAGFGLLLAFTPCMLPMIPILSGIIVGHGHHAGKARALILSTVYVLGMAITYAAAGVAAGLSGTLLSAALQNPWVLGSFATLFVILSLAMFGFYELQLPTFLQSRLSTQSTHLHGGTLGGVAAMGALSAVIVGPCVAAPLAGALLYIGQTGDAWLGGTALFAMALGMGAPLIAGAVSAGHFLPHTGPWMEAVKKFFGVVLLATALWIASPVLPPVLVMLGWALLLIVPAIYLHALDPIPHPATHWKRFWKGIGLAMLVAGATLLVGTLAGSRDPLQPLSVLTEGRASPSAAAPSFEPVKTVSALDARLVQAKTAGQPVMLDFYADWCVSCKELERYTFADARVAAKLKKMVLLRADVTANDTDDQAMLSRFKLFGPPGLVFWNGQGNRLDNLLTVGFVDATAFLEILASVGG